ncbi:Na+:solute symporter [Noviherbaspirillum saxi]|uniref:Na+:solute symporter n=1 Tax=Noviherbaspirillum saxi TaxID=2320863 RepID=UPI0011C46596|nr:Na+:solute symporter [Noviherbaspirillum saxi]
MKIGVGAISLILLLQAFNSFACYKHNFSDYLHGVMIFLFIPLLPAVISLFLPNALRAVGACACLAPWLILAYYVDCIKPYTDGGASMSYIAVLFYGTPCAIIGAIITGPLTRMFGININKR